MTETDAKTKLDAQWVVNRNLECSLLRAEVEALRTRVFQLEKENEKLRSHQ